MSILLSIYSLYTKFIGISAYGIYNSRKNQTAEDYFLADKNTPWWIAMFSIVATETSVLTFVSIPGLAYRSDWFFLQLALGYIVGRVLVSVFLLPLYFKGDITSIYEVIGNRFGTVVQKAASGIFLVTRLFADGVRFLATAVVVQVVIGWPIWIAVLIIGIVTMIYTLSGGIRTVLWVDTFQFVLYLAGGAIVILFILSSAQFSGWDQLLEVGKTFKSDSTQFNSVCRALIQFPMTDISKSVARILRNSSLTVNKALLIIGSVDLGGVALDSSCNFFNKVFLSMVNFIFILFL